MSMKDLQSALVKGMIGRREFMAGAMALGATASTASLFAAQAAETPQKGGQLKVGFQQGSTTDSLDPATFNNDFMFAIGYAVFNGLTEITPDGKAAGELAESYEATPDAKVWTFRLRSDVVFSDGSKLTSADVIATLNHHMSEQSKSGIKPLLAQISAMKAQGDHTVVFELESGNADFPFVFNDYHLGIRKAVDGKIDPLSPIGTGGYTIEAFEPGVRALLKRRDGYWKEGRAHIDEVEILAIADAAARLNSLMTGEVDLIDRPDLKTIHLLKRRPGINIHTQNGTLHYTLPMHTDTAPFDDVNVRMALKYSIDREELVEKVLQGYGAVGNDQPISSSVPYFNAELEQRSYDPDKAKFHLKQAGLSSLDVTLHTADAAFGGAVDASLLFSESAKAAGINVKVHREPNDGYWSNVWLQKSFSASYWGGRPTPDLMFSAAYAAGADWNETRWKNPRFNELLVSARAELDQGKRAEMYGEMQSICSNEGGAIIPMFGQYVSAMSDKVKKPAAVTEMWDLDSQRFIERWWVA
ncbi:ABC transporter substrate-binding protein [Kiloniella sp. b19]|uniref:ABC transporter substrate-binding protein n=1 Tax=Kiloniella sp. GXU_MW_B19 TaxID=3141326 RepID=UPI0031D8F255